MQFFGICNTGGLADVNLGLREQGSNSSLNILISAIDGSHGSPVMQVYEPY